MKQQMRHFTLLALLLLGGCLGPPRGVDAVTGFDAGRYMGEWFAVMRHAAAGTRNMLSKPTNHWYIRRALDRMLPAPHCSASASDCLVELAF